MNPPIRKGKFHPCVVPACTRLANTAGLCESHYHEQLRGHHALPCPKCGEPLREPAAACGWCIEEAPRGRAA